MKKKKTVLAAVILLLMFVVGGAIAYFTDTDTKTNTFTIGSVDITLTETGWDALTDTDSDGIPDAAEDMMPGESVTKDPLVNNISTKNPAYVFVKVEVPCTTVESPATPEEIFTYTVNAGWTELSTAAVACTSGGTATHVYYYGSNGTLTALAEAADASTPTSTTNPVFSSITLRSTLTGNEGLSGNKNVVVTGYGIQTEGLQSTTPADVWSNF
ncbi:MAG: SipW-dependent-type signal peptide-containing protein [Bacilli bacterium]|jgi:predicted ribosomally synthesized peptide with SipW-like signal peptide|nr:SipW-dependent-type signal peptide-containing protein [Bacilli bacterium]